MRSPAISPLLIAAWIYCGVAAPAFARGGKSYHPSGHVVHSRRAPVLMHKAVPPYGGVHVYEKNETSRRTERAK